MPTAALEHTPTALGDGVTIHGPHILIAGHGQVVAWRTWQILTPDQVEDGPWPAGWRDTGERRTLPDGSCLWLRRRSAYLTWFTGAIDRHPDGTIDDRSNINGGRIFKVFVSAAHRRKGLATAMLTLARTSYPNLLIRHSGALSADGVAWAAARP